MKSLKNWNRIYKSAVKFSDQKLNSLQNETLSLISLLLFEEIGVSNRNFNKIMLPVQSRLPSFNMN